MEYFKHDIDCWRKLCLSGSINSKDMIYKYLRFIQYLKILEKFMF